MALVARDVRTSSPLPPPACRGYLRRATPGVQALDVHVLHGAATPTRREQTPLLFPGEADATGRGLVVGRVGFGVSALRGSLGLARVRVGRIVVP